MTDLSVGETVYTIGAAYPDPRVLTIERGTIVRILSPPEVRTTKGKFGERVTYYVDIAVRFSDGVTVVGDTAGGDYYKTPEDVEDAIRRRKESEEI